MGFTGTPVALPLGELSPKVTERAYCVSVSEMGVSSSSAVSYTHLDCLLRYRVDRQTADAVRDFCEANGITGIRIQQDSKRWYPQGEFLASVLGFTNVDNAGVSGLELKYDDLLTGENGVVLTAVNAWGYTLEQSCLLYTSRCV